MADTLIESTPQNRAGARGKSRRVKSDGGAGPPLIIPPASAIIAAQPTNIPGAPNAALKEPKLDTDREVDPAHPCRGRLRVVDADHGIVEEFAPDGSRRKKIAICGFASSTRKYIPHHDPSWSIWLLNQLYRHVPRADRTFDIHYNWDQEVVPGTDHRKGAQECGIPFYTIARQPDLPTNVRYPLERVIAAFQADYFTSTIPYMIGLAMLEIDEQVKGELAVYVKATPKRQLEAQDLVAVQKQLYGQYSIGIFGIDLVVGGEYFHEKPCAEFWCGAAAIGRGINLLIPPESALCKHLYRYGTDVEHKQLVKVDEIRGLQAQARTERDEQLKKLYMLEGVMDATERIAQTIELRGRGATV